MTTAMSMPAGLLDRSVTHIADLVDGTWRVQAEVFAGPARLTLDTAAFTRPNAFTRPHGFVRAPGEFTVPVAR